MKKNLLQIAFAAFLLLFVAPIVGGANFAVSAQQQRTLSGTVVDENGEPIPGVTVLVVGTTMGVVTNLDGIFTLSNVPADASIEVSFVGYATQKVEVAGRSSIDIVLIEDVQLLDEVVVVGYGTQKKVNVTSAVATISAEDIVSTKQADVVASLQGKVPGLLIRQKSGTAGDFDSDMSIRGFGGEPMVIVDGVKRTAQRGNTFWRGSYTDSGTAFLASMNPDDIESISVLKDASASIYGIGSENGVILVTTKKGNVGKPQVSFSSRFIFGVPTANPEQVDMVTYLEAENEMARNSRRSIPYSQEFIDHYRNGDEGYVDTDWYDVVQKDFSFSSNYNFSVRGGNDQTQYYLSSQISDQNGLFTTGIDSYKSYSLQANVTSKITKDLSFTFQTSLMGSTQENMTSNNSLNYYYYVALADRTIGATTLDNPNHYSDPGGEGRNPLALANPDNNYLRTFQDQVNNNLDITYTVPFIKGLKIQASGALDFNKRITNTMIKKFSLYDYRTDAYSQENKDNNSYSESWNYITRTYARVQANYNNTFGKHRVGATLAGEMTKTANKSVGGARQYGDFFTHPTVGSGDATTATNSGTRSQSATGGYVGRVNYDYAGKYLVEVMARYDATYVYAPGKRWGLFPSYSLGWRISEESFIKDNVPWLSNLKLRWSDGKTGSQQGSAYAYLLGYTSSGAYVFNDGGQYNGYSSHSVAQTLLSWADVRMMNFGVDMEIFNGIFGGSFEIFKRKTTGTAATASTTVPDFYGLSLPQQNLNSSENVGLELQLNHRKRFNKFNYSVTATATYARSRTTYLEAEKTAIYSSHQDYYNRYTVGRWGNARSANSYHWTGGQFETWEEINNSKVMYSTTSAQYNMLPGMYELEDRDGNGVINSRDVYYEWAEANPPLQYGLMISGGWRNLDFNLNFNGATLVNKTVSLSGGMGYGFFSSFTQNYQDHYRLADPDADPFDPQSQWIAGYFPAIAKATSAYDGSSNATYRYAQPYNFVNGTYLRLKSLEVGYTLPKNLTQKAKISTARISFSGTNLLTFCNKLLKPYDPERNQNSYLGVGGTPLMKNFNLGINLTF